VLAHEFHQRLADQARLARTGHASDRSEDPQWDPHIEAMQVVALDAEELEPA